MSNQNQNPQIPSRRSWLVITCLAVVAIIWIAFPWASEWFPATQRKGIGFAAILMTIGALAVLVIDYRRA